MDVKVKKLGIAIAAVITAAIISGAMSDDANARSRKHVDRMVAPPPPSIGYYGSFPVELDYAQAQALSLEHPYYTHFMYDYCDYRNCVLRWNGNSWVPVWYGPVS